MLKECKVMYLGNLKDFVLAEDRYLTEMLLIPCKKTEALTSPHSIREVYIMEGMTYQLRTRENVFGN